MYAIRSYYGSHNVTISWNYLHDHYKTMLYGSSDTDTGDVDITVTLHHNYFKVV